MKAGDCYCPLACRPALKELSRLADFLRVGFEQESIDLSSFFEEPFAFS
jgi:hypothetical protein